MNVALPRTVRFWIVWMSVIVASLPTAVRLSAQSVDNSSPSAANASKSAEQPFTTAQIEFFENKIRPVFVEHCLECHGSSPDKIRGGLRLTSREQILSGGDSGPAIVLGKPDASLLIQSLHYDEFEMPPSGQLSDEEIQNIARWIEMGAPDPRTPNDVPKNHTIDLRQGRQFWSFQPVVKPSIPQSVTTADSWCRSDLDRFLLKSFRENGLQPNPDADRSTLLRRTHLALTGLPPEPEQIEAFVASENALGRDLAQVVDELLDSPHFGERWGRHWLDVARFAESSGGGRSLMFPVAWRYRDYVIDAYNRDKPFNQMVLEQLAGDLLPAQNLKQRNEQIVATGFLALGPTNYEQQDKGLLQMEVIDEQVDTTGRAFLAMTLGCARCHDHKFDPIPTRDYYAMAGIFGSTESLVDGNVSSYVTETLATDIEKQAFSNHQSQVKRLTKELKSVEQTLKKLGKNHTESKSNTRVIVSSKELEGIVVDDVAALKIGKWTESTSVKQYVDHGYVHDLNDTRGRKSIVFNPTLEHGGDYEVRLAYAPGANRASNALVTIDHQDGKAVQRINQSQNPDIDDLFVSLGTFRFEADNVARVTISNEDADGVVIADAVQFLSRKLNRDSKPAKNAKAKKPQSTEETLKRAVKSDSDSDRLVSDNRQPRSAQKEGKQIREAEAKRSRIEKRLKELKRNAPPALAKAMSVKDRKNPCDGHIHVRGSVRNLGDRVPRGFLQVVTWDGAESQSRIPEHTSGRLELARWIADEHNPLTARVYVNRVWRHLFGKGLVETTDNFGQMGQRPSNDELLDYLASSFVDQGWSTKKLIREIILSRAFRLSSQRNEKCAAIDPENRFLWRANRRQADAEVLRDSLLFASDELDLTPGGLTIRKLAQYDFGYVFNSRRRSVYVPAFRNSILPLFEVFDIANPNMVVGNRSSSTLPTQALFLMNNPWVLERAKAIRKRVCEESSDDRERLKLTYLRLLGRAPTDEELVLSMRYLASFDSDEISRSQAWDSLVHAILSSLDFRYIN